MTECELDPCVIDETDKEQLFDLYINIEKILTRAKLEECLERLKVSIIALHGTGKVIEKKEEKKDAKTKG